MNAFHASPLRIRGRRVHSRRIHDRFLALGSCALLVLFTCIVAPSCLDPADGPVDRPAGVYQLISYDDAGSPVVRGWLELDFPDSVGVVGRWHLDPIGNPQRIGPQVGDGALAGERAGDSLYIDLNPRMADNNVLLRGKLAATRFTGRWAWVSFAGVSSEGTFRASRP